MRKLIAGIAAISVMLVGAAPVMAAVETDIAPGQAVCIVVIAGEAVVVNGCPTDGTPPPPRIVIVDGRGNVHLQTP